MPRARNIKPSLFKNEILGEADPLITILFTGLWCLADREGRMEDRPKRIKVEVFPYRDGINVDEMLGWLEDNSFIHRYQVDDESYIQIRKFHTHQRPHHMESESLIPPMPGDKNKLSAKPLYKKQKERILERDGGRCVKCGATEKLHIDHVIPVSKGGTSDDDNLQVLCATCNCSKGARIENESRTNRERIDETASCSTDSLNLIPDSGLPDSSNTDTPPKSSKGESVNYDSWPELPDPQILKDWIASRKKLKASNSQTAMNRIGKELQKANEIGLSVNDCLSECVTRGWKGFKAEWMTNAGHKPNYPASQQGDYNGDGWADDFDPHAGPFDDILNGPRPEDS